MTSTPRSIRGPAQSRWRRAQIDDLLDGAFPVEFVLRFTFSHPDMDTTIVGTINPAHLQSNIDASQKGALPSDIYVEAKQRLTDAGFVPQAA